MIMRKGSALFLLVAFITVLAGCQNSEAGSLAASDNASNTGEILVEYLSRSGGLQTYEESCFDTAYQVTTDKKIRCYLECSDPDVAPEIMDVFTVDMTEETYNALAKIVRKKDVLNLDPKEDRDVCDGYSYYLRMYDANGELLGRAGGYMPTNKTMEKVRSLIMQDIPKDKLEEIRKVKEPYLKY